MRDSNKQPLYFIAQIQDITERKLAENKLKKNSKQLEEINSDLQRFNRVAVDREERMIELKEKINQLSEQLGQKPLYDLSFLNIERNNGEDNA